MEKSCTIRFLIINISCFLFVIAFDSTVLCYSQNLINNGSFENYLKCPDNIVSIGEKLPVSDWFIPNRSSPDYFNSCCKFNVGVPVNFMGQVFAKDGYGYVGLILTEKPNNVNIDKKPLNYREFVSSELKSVLIKDSIYNIKFSYCVAQHSTYGINTLGVALSSKTHSFKKRLKQSDYVLTDTLEMKIETGVWHQFDIKFKATGIEKYITIGNFSKDDEINYGETDISDISNFMKRQIRENSIAYYYIDNVELTLLISH